MTKMSWELLLWLLALCAPLLLLARADGDLTLLWAEWQGRRPGEERTWPPAPSERAGPQRSKPVDLRLLHRGPGSKGCVEICAFPRG